MSDQSQETTERVSLADAVREDTDDQLDALEIPEAGIRSRNSGEGDQGAGGSPMMMPPMMGGLGRGGTGAPGATAAPAAAPAAGGVAAPLPTVGANGAAPTVAPTAGGAAAAAAPAGVTMGAVPSIAVGAPGVRAAQHDDLGELGVAQGQPAPEPASGVVTTEVRPNGGDLSSLGRTSGTAAPAPGRLTDPSYTVEAGALDEAARGWADMAARATRVADGGHTMRASFGLLAEAQEPHQNLSTKAMRWTSGAAQEFDGLHQKLRRTAQEYATAEDEGAAQARRVF